MKEQTSVKPALRCLARVIKVAILTGTGIGLVSCTATDSQTAQGPATSATTTPATPRPATTGSQVIELPELNSNNAAETQRLINEINRDGNPLDFDDYREQAPGSGEIPKAKILSS